MKGKSTKFAVPSQNDLQILAVLWEKGSATVREVHEALVAKGMIRPNVAYTTVKTYLDRLVQKGSVVVEIGDDSRGTYQYTAAVSREDIRDHSSLLNRVLSALEMDPLEYLRWFFRQRKLSQEDKAKELSPPEFAHWFFQPRKLSQEDKAELEELLRNFSVDETLSSETSPAPTPPPPARRTLKRRRSQS